MLVDHVDVFGDVDSEQLFPQIVVRKKDTDDVCFEATMRALLPQRIGADHVCFFCSRPNAMDAIVNEDESFKRTNGIYIFEVEKEEVKKMLCEKIIREACFEECQDLSAFLSRFSPAIVYTRKDGKCALILAEQINIREYHPMASLISRYLPAYFKENPLNEKEHALVLSLVNGSNDDFKARIDEVVEKSAYQKKKTVIAINRFEKARRAKLLKEAETKIKITEKKINDNMEAYRVLCNELQETRIKISGLQLSEPNNYGELIDYLETHPMIEVESVGNNSISIIVKTTLDCFDSDCYNAVVSRNNYIFTNERRLNAASQRALFDSIFGDDPLLDVKICAHYELNFGGDVYSPSSRRYPDSCKDYVPNPHLQLHGCLGDYRRYINAFLLKNDFVGAIEQCINSAKSVNIAETMPTFLPFIQEILGNNNKIFRIHGEKTDEHDMTLEEAFTYVCEKKGIEK